MSDIPQKIMDKIEEYIVSKIGRHYEDWTMEQKHFKTSFNEGAMFCYHLRDEEVEEWVNKFDKKVDEHDNLWQKLQNQKIIRDAWEDALKAATEQLQQKNILIAELSNQLQQKDQEIEQLRRFLCDLNNAMNVLRQNKYSEQVIGYAESVHRNYHKEFDKYEAQRTSK